MVANARTVAVYCRVSTDAQTTASQKNALRIAVRRYAGRIVWYTETISGGAETRPALGELGKAIAAGKVERVLVFALDRLSRRGVLDGLKYLEAWTAKGVVVESLQEPWVQATADPALRELMLSIAFWGARQQRERIRQCVTAGLRAAKARGVQLGRRKGDTGHPWALGKRKIDVALARSLRSQGVPIREVATRFGVSRAGLYYALAQETPSE